MTTNETTVTYSSDETTNAVDYVSAIVFAARTKAQEALAAKHAAEREEVQALAARRLEMLEIARANMPEAIRAFVDVEPAPGNDQWRAVIHLPGCAPFAQVIHASFVRSFFYPAEFYNNDDDEPTLSISWSTISSTLADEIARAYEAQDRYNKARDAWEHAERESALRHEEEPEPPALKLDVIADSKILAMIAGDIAAADEIVANAELTSSEIADYRLKRAMALAAYIQAQNSAHD